jgi:hypothetical protein
VAISLLGARSDRPPNLSCPRPVCPVAGSMRLPMYKRGAMILHKKTRMGLPLPARSIEGGTRSTAVLEPKVCRALIVSFSLRVSPQSHGRRSRSVESTIQRDSDIKPGPTGGGAIPFSTVHSLSGQAHSPSPGDSPSGTACRQRHRPAWQSSPHSDLR